MSGRIHDRFGTAGAQDTRWGVSVRGENGQGGWNLPWLSMPG